LAVFFSLQNKGLVNSTLSSDMMHVKDLYLTGRRMKVGNEKKRTSFSGDSWPINSPLKDKFLEPFNICNEQGTSLADSAILGWRFCFRTWLYVYLQEQMSGLVNLLVHVNLNEQYYSPLWK
jgi:hypothetical protein